jgi:hypothetical protein
MTAYPVHYIAERPARFTRFQLLVRVLAVIVLGIAGMSLGLVFTMAYLGLPLFAAARLAGGRDPAAYVEEDGARIARLLRWLAAVYAWFGLVAERVPERPDETVHVEIERAGRPTPASALWRLIIGPPSALVLWLLGAIGGLVWLWAALCVLVSERVGEGAFAYLAGLQRWAIRLLAYQASIVEPYPPFSFEELPPAFPAARAAP